MPRKAVVDAVAARLVAVWSTPPVIGMNTQGETPDDGSDYIVVQYPVANMRRLPVNQGYYQEEGVIRFVLHAQRGLGVAGPLTKADSLADLFRYQKFGGVKTQTPSSPLVHDDNDQGNYFVVSFGVPYTFDYQD